MLLIIIKTQKTSFINVNLKQDRGYCLVKLKYELTVAFCFLSLASVYYALAYKKFYYYATGHGDSPIYYMFDKMNSLYGK